MPKHLLIQYCKQMIYKMVSLKYFISSKQSFSHIFSQLGTGTFVFPKWCCENLMQNNTQTSKIL